MALARDADMTGALSVPHSPHLPYHFPSISTILRLPFKPDLFSFSL
jgi:hypothetical protein